VQLKVAFLTPAWVPEGDRQSKVASGITPPPAAALTLIQVVCVEVFDP
jgi:hypothetical protein